MAIRRDGKDAELTIADNGPGIKVEDSEKVFERFWRADTSRQRNTGGTGLGLAIVQSLVVAHGGTVRLISEPGSGAEFRIRIPIAAPAPTGD
jgi:signal transduction histidine kinase